MDGRNFDELTRKLATGASRRSFFKGLIGGGAALIGLGRASGTLAKANSKIDICHKTGSTDNPWVWIAVSDQRLRKEHLAHGDVIMADGSECCRAQDCPGTDQCNIQTCNLGTPYLFQNRLTQLNACGAIVPRANGTLCNADNSLCTVDDYCSGGTCVAGEPVECPEPDQCHDPGTCDPATGLCSNPAKTDGTLCNADDDLCTVDDYCSGGTCVPGNPVQCPQPDQCHVPGTCIPSTGECTDPEKEDGAPCNADDDLCTVNDSCQDGECVAGTPVNCLVPDTECWTAGTCDPGTGLCSDPTLNSGYCYIEATCVADEGLNPANECQWCDADLEPEAWSARPNGTACDEFVCSICSEGLCVNDPDNRVCPGDASSVCCPNEQACGSGGECCEVGEVACPIFAIAPVVGDCCPSIAQCNAAGDCCLADTVPCGNTCCSSLNACCDGACCEAGVCLRDNEPEFCCTTGLSCLVGDGPDECCEDSEAYECCGNDGCCPTGQCNHTSSICCADGDVPCGSTCCAIGQCNLDGICCITGDFVCGGFCCDAATEDCCGTGPSAYCVPDDSTCCTQDADCVSLNSCTGTGNLTWTEYLCGPGGYCEARIAVSCDDGVFCTDDICTPSTGCWNPAKENNTPCDDGNDCTIGDSCQAGVCAGGASVICTALDDCHLPGTCDPETGACSNPAKADGSPCNDGNACTQTDTCQAGACVGANPVVCAASDQCHDVGTCDPGTGVCSNPAKADGSACNDGNACTQTDTCQAGACVGANPVVCAASDQCHDAGTCDPETGACSNPAKADGTLCNDGNACTQTDTCQAGACVGANPVVCTASDQCHVAGTCNPSTGQCSNPAAADGTTCSDNDVCTTGEVCTAGICGGGTSVTCTSPATCCTSGSFAGQCLRATGVDCGTGSSSTRNARCCSGVCNVPPGNNLCT